MVDLLWTWRWTTQFNKNILYVDQLTMNYFKETLRRGVTHNSNENFSNPPPIFRGPVSQQPNVLYLRTFLYLWWWELDISMYRMWREDAMDFRRLQCEIRHILAQHFVSATVNPFRTTGFLHHVLYNLSSYHDWPDRSTVDMGTKWWRKWTGWRVLNCGKFE
jgi:hypothetical protein